MAFLVTLVHVAQSLLQWLRIWLWRGVWSAGSAVPPCLALVALALALSFARLAVAFAWAWGCWPGVAL